MILAWIYYYHDGCQMTIFYFHHSFHIYQLALLCKAEISLFFHLFIDNTQTDILFDEFLDF